MEKPPLPPNPLQSLIDGLSDLDPTARIQAADAIAFAAEEGMNTSAALPGLAKLLGDTPEVIKHASRALWVCFLKGGNLSAVLPSLEPLLESPLVEVRATVSRIISRYKIIKGEELPLKLHPDFKVPPTSRKCSWTVNVSHRRTYAPTDQPISGEVPRTCGACNGEKTNCIYVYERTEEDVPSQEIEYKCTSCGKYTLYTREDW